jgi:hypothetical protein
MILEGFARTFHPAARTFEKAAYFQRLIWEKTANGSP